VSTPLTWKEVEKGVDPRDFTIRTAMARFREVGDLWAPVRTGKRVNIQAVLKRSGAL
jgi:bifunctional non-homologous end joining protein LigD